MLHSKRQHIQMQHCKMQHIKIQRSKMRHSKMQHNKMQHSKMQHNKMLHSNMQHGRIFDWALVLHIAGCLFGRRKTHDIPPMGFMTKGTSSIAAKGNHDCGVWAEAAAGAAQGLADR